MQISKLKTIAFFSSEIGTAHDLRKWIELQRNPSTGDTAAERSIPRCASKAEGKVLQLKKTLPFSQAENQLEIVEKRKTEDDPGSRTDEGP